MQPEPPVDAVEAAASEYHVDDPMIHSLTKIIRLTVRGLAILMTAVIVFGVFDVVYVLYQRLLAPPVGLLEISDILATFGAFMAVLIAIEIFVNITVYLREDVVHVKIVMATALMAIARKVIILDFQETTAVEAASIAGLVLAMSIGYWLVALRGTGMPEMPKVPRARRRER
jgi:uncharacterized membrane protein (DUF373 family)